MEMTLYHFAKKKYIVDILCQGLRINTGHRGLGRISDYMSLHKMQPIFLTSDPDYVVETMDRRVYDSCYLLEVDCKGLDIEPEHDWAKIYVHPKFYPNGVQKTFICKKDISAEKLTLRR